jgi:hypothetical protein
MTAREQIDAVLKYLYEKKDESRAIDLNLIEANEELLKIAESKHELQRIIIELRDDKYIQMYPDYPLKPDGTKEMGKGLLTYCSITFNGRLFWENGGYAQQKINDDSERIRVENIEISQLELGEKLNLVTAWIACGTIALVLVELVRLALDYHWFSYHK